MKRPTWTENRCTTADAFRRVPSYREVTRNYVVTPINRNPIVLFANGSPNARFRPNPDMDIINSDRKNRTAYLAVAKIRLLHTIATAAYI